VDFSKPIIKGILMANGYTDPVFVQYLNKCWDDLLLVNSKWSLIIHICSWHSDRFLRRKMAQCFPNLDTDENLKSILYSWQRAYTSGRTWNSFEHRIRQIIILTGKKRMTSNQLREIKESVMQRSPRTCENYVLIRYKQTLL
jgi:hypothetical protein